MIGQHVGNYLLIRQLGDGGMGVVYEAVHQQLDRHVAIKFLHAELIRNEQLVARFLDEARAVNLVRHPGLVSIFEIDRLPDGRPYIIMELLSGESLAQTLRRSRGGLPVLQALRITRQVADTLHAAHLRDIVHRDLKPDNLMLTPDAAIEGGERVKVLDFGIARMAQELRAAGSQKTRTGTVLGTPAYMAPEQCRGAAVDGKADVYALGIVLYELLVGRPPFLAENFGEIIVMHMSYEPPALGALCPTLPGEVIALVEQMLAKDPAARPSMSQVHETTGRVLAHPGLLTAPLPVFTPARTPVPRQPTPLPRGGSTISLAAGEPTPPAKDPLPTTLVVLGVLLVGGAAATATAALVSRQPRSLVSVTAPAAPPATPPPAPPTVAAPAPSAAPPMVTWVLRSQPGVATLFDAQTGVSLGQTPLVLSRPASATLLQLQLRRRGYRSALIVLNLAESGERLITLNPEETAHAAKPPVPIF